MKKNCSDCGLEYEAQTITIGNREIVLSPYCHTCREKRRTEMEETERRAIEREIADRKSEWIKTSGIPDKFLKESFETYLDRGHNTLKIKQLCRTYAEDFPVTRPVGFKSLVITSPSIWGVGKSHLACSIAKSIIEKYASKMVHSPAYYITEPALFRRVRSTYNHRPDQETEDMVIEHLTEVPLLIVDDMGKEEVADPRFVQRIWFSILNGRYENELPIVITANLTADEIEHWLGGSRKNEASYDRLYEMVGGEFWKLNGTTKRKENKNG